MNGEKEQQLIEYLESLGFKGEQLSGEVLEKSRLNLPSFSVPHKIDFGKEVMFYDLKFQPDSQFQAYRLYKYHATHRAEVNIEHKTINGIDTAMLEARMQREDWHGYFKQQQTHQYTQPAPYVQETIEMLNKIADHQNFDGQKIQEELMFKYWPDEYYDHTSKQELKDLYEHGRDFSSTEHGLCNATLAFHEVSGRFIALYEFIEATGVEAFSGADLYGKMEKALSDDVDAFEITAWRSLTVGHLDFSIPVEKLNGEYNAEHINVTLKQNPAIEHGIHNEVDTRKLEELMMKVDWDDDKLFFNTDSDPEFRPDVADILEQMQKLSQDVSGAKVADMLSLKFWPESQLFDGLITENAWKMLDTLPMARKTFPIEYKMPLITNLMCGRPVTDNHLIPGLKESSNWSRLDLSNKNHDGDYPIVHVNGKLSTDDLFRLLGQVPLSHRSRHQINLLTQGEQLIEKLADGTILRIEANPERETLDIYNAAMQKIPVNLHFDADWKPPMVHPPHKIEPSQHRIESTPQKAKEQPRKRFKGRKMR